MKLSRRDIQAIDWTAMPTVDPSALKEEQRAVYDQNRRVIDAYVSGSAISDIAKHHAVARSQIYRLIARCCATHEDGRVYGYRALLPQARVKDYERSSPLNKLSETGSRGTAGAFIALLEKYPALVDWMHEEIRRRRVRLHQTSTANGLKTRLVGIVAAHQRFVSQCRELGLQIDHYPLNSNRRGRGALGAAFRQEILRRFSSAARSAGAKHLKGLPRLGEDQAPAANFPLDVVEFDGHRLDVRLKVVVDDPLGGTHEFEIERIWLLVILDVCTRAVLGYHLCLGREYSRYDVIRTIERALEPHAPIKFTLPGLQNAIKGAFPSTRFPELNYATWRWIKIDHAKANLAQDSLHALCEFLGCFVNAGPVYCPDDRPFVERFFGTLISNLSSRLPGYTGSHPQDVRRALSDPHGNLRLFVSISELDQLMEASLCEYNATPHRGLYGRSPLEAMDYQLRTRAAVLQWLPEAKRRTLCLMQTPKRARVRGYIDQGVRAHINFLGVRYTSWVLAATTLWIGKEVRIYYNSRDLRGVRAFLTDGTEIGELKAQGAWSEFVHDIELRRAILRETDWKRLATFADPSFLEAYVRDKLKTAKQSRRAASELARTVRALATAPTAMTPFVSATAEVIPLPTNAERRAEAPAQPTGQVPRRKIEPEILSIGTGYAGPGVLTRI